MADIRCEDGNGSRAKGTSVIVIGAGLAGLTAAVQAVKAGAKVRLIAQGWGEQMVAPGWISVCDRADDDVIAEVRGYAALHPDHPYALAEDDAFVCGIDAFRDLAQEIGLPYDERRKDGHNLHVITLLGAIQKTMLAPRGIANSDLTNIAGPILLVGFNGWRDFHPELAAGNLQAQGVDARAIRVDLPELGPRSWDLWPGDLAKRFDAGDFRSNIIRQIKPHTQRVEKVGFPAVLGIDQHLHALNDFSDQLDRTIFEIPTLPPSMPGTRLSHRLRGWLLRRGARVQIGHPVVDAIVKNGRCLAVKVAGLGHRNTFYADQFVLATGGLYNGGILSDEAGRLWEPIFDLPIERPSGAGREDWHYVKLLKERGHLVYRRTGVRVNKEMRPLNPEGEPVLKNVFVVGKMLAGFNPLTDGCAEGIALATAYKAVRVALKLDEVRSPRNPS